MSSERSALPLGATAAPPRRGASVALRWLVALALLGGGGYGGWAWWDARGRAWWHARRAKTSTRATYTVRRGDLPITVKETGSLKALKSEVIASKVEGKATIIRLVPEGTRITDKDVADKRILVELDSADLRDRLTQQEITFATAKASYTEAKEAYDIQKSQSESDINQSKLDVKFSRMDLERYVGENLASQALAGKADLLALAGDLYDAAVEHRRNVEADIERALAQVDDALREAEKKRAATDTAPPTPAPASGSPKPNNPHPPDPPNPGTSFPRVRAAASEGAAKSLPALGGAALQNQRKLEGDIDLAIEEAKRAADKLIWTAKLESEGYVSHSELDADALALKRQLINLDQALTARELFLRYELPKEAEQLLSLYSESQRELTRVEARSRSTLAQKEADRASKEATYLRNEAKLDKLKEQVQYCIIRATNPGIVVYASSVGRRHYRSSSGPIEEGSQVYERQEIIRLPDLSSLAVSVGIHESVIDKIRVGQPADVYIDALPHLRLKGQIKKVGVLPTPQRWWNPDLKVYDTDIPIEGSHPPQLKPGMSARVEIEIKTLKDILMVPVQAVSMWRGKTVVFRLVGGAEEPMEVVLGESNDQFVEIRKGLVGGEEILLEAPQTVPIDERRKPERKRPGKKKRPDQPEARAAGKRGFTRAGSKTPGSPQRRPRSPGEDSGKRRKFGERRGRRPPRRPKPE